MTTRGLRFGWSPVFTGGSDGPNLWVYGQTTQENEEPMTTQAVREYWVALRNRKQAQLLELQEELATIDAALAILLAEGTWNIQYASKSPNGRQDNETDLQQQSNQELMLTALRRSEGPLTDTDIVDYLSERGVTTTAVVVSATLNRLVNRPGSEVSRPAPRTFAWKEPTG